MCERYIIWLPLAYPQLGTWPATQACAVANWWPFDLQAGIQSTEPHQPGYGGFLTLISHYILSSTHIHVTQISLFNSFLEHSLSFLTSVPSNSSPVLNSLLLYNLLFQILPTVHNSAPIPLALKGCLTSAP